MTGLGEDLRWITWSGRFWAGRRMVGQGWHGGWFLRLRSIARESWRSHGPRSRDITSYCFTGSVAYFKRRPFRLLLDYHSFEFASFQMVVLLDLLPCSCSMLLLLDTSPKCLPYSKSFGNVGCSNRSYTTAVRISPHPLCIFATSRPGWLASCLRISYT